MKNLFYYIIFILALTGCTDLDEPAQNHNIFVEYKLLREYDPQVEYHMKRHLVGYFSDIALGSEYGSQFAILKKWHSPMKIYVDGSKDEVLIEELQNIITEINSYCTDDFKISLVENQEESNFHLFFGSHISFGKQYLELMPLLRDNHGLFQVHLNNNFEITSGEMYVDLDRITTIEKQKHILREELTQSIGLANDIKYYPNSIFFRGDSQINSYSLYDKEVIRLLYHSQIISGLSENTVRQQLNYILGID